MQVEDEIEILKIINSYLIMKILNIFSNFILQDCGQRFFGEEKIGIV
ncbi:MAG: hypothetical protein ACTSQE_16370 [Candidatus Heimdallarchaeaceae archaeon]